MLGDDLAAVAGGLLDAAPCRVSLPAGAGKTELVAAAGLIATEANRQVLVLTHTHAGVDAIRRRAQRLGSPRTNLRVMTIDGWCRRLVEAFPQIAGYEPADPPSWDDIRNRTRVLLASPHVQRMMNSSVDLLIVDEYQDCSSAQHDVVCTLADIAHAELIVFGDPLQAIYDFPGDPVIDWEDVDDLPEFAIEVEPWRWRSHNQALGQELLELRQVLIDGDPVDLSAFTQLRWVQESSASRRQTAWSISNEPGTIAVLERWGNTAEALARQLGGRFGMMEELEGTRLLAVADALDGGDGLAAVIALIGFAKQCHANLPQQLSQKCNAMQETGEFPNFTSGNAAAPALEPLRTLADALSPESLLAALAGLDKLGGTRFGKEAWRDFRLAAGLWRDDPDMGLRAAVQAVRDRSRVRGRRAEQRTVTRTLLVKGLEYDHCVVNRADELTRCELYVALTRARSTVTVLSNDPVITPTA